MKQRSLIRQAMFLSGSHFFVRVLGFIMRIWLSHKLGAAAMGLVELAHSAQMLLITPVVSGLPAAVSRMSAKSSGDPAQQNSVLRCGAALALLTGIPLSIMAYWLRAPIAGWLGDLRTLPALVVYLPCIPILGVSCALNGYFYGTGRPVPPAIGEIIEQIVRFLLSICLISRLQGEPLTLRAAIPAAGTLIGETVSLLFMLAFCLTALFGRGKPLLKRQQVGEMLSLALPLTGMKLVSSLMRTVAATLIPSCLQRSGLPAQEALSQLGMMNGMLMPMLLLPSFVTGSLCMVTAPELSRRQARNLPMRSMCLRVFAAALCAGLIAMTGVRFFAPLIAHRLYRQAELLPLLERFCTLIPIMSLTQVSGGMMNGLGLQRISLRISLFSSLANVLLTYVLAAMPALRIQGALIAMGLSQIITLFFSLFNLRSAINPDRGYISESQAQGRPHRW